MMICPGSLRTSPVNPGTETGTLLQVAPPGPESENEFVQSEVLIFDIIYYLFLLGQTNSKFIRNYVNNISWNEITDRTKQFYFPLFFSTLNPFKNFSLVFLHETSKILLFLKIMTLTGSSLLIIQSLLHQSHFEKNAPLSFSSTFFIKSDWCRTNVWKSSFVK